METLLKKEDLEKVLAVKAIIEKEYHYHYTQDELAQKVGVNRNKLKIYFRLVTGMALYEYLTHVRIEKTKELLEITYLPLKDIADKVGLDKSNLNRSFKKATGITPKEWRKIKQATYCNTIISDITFNKEVQESANSHTFQANSRRLLM